MGVLMWCPQLSGTRSSEVCIYNCPKGRVLKCSEYTRKYEEILKAPIHPLYIDKYGDPVILVPMALRKRRSRKCKPKKEEEVAVSE